ncbi:Hypothetical predicted protein [Scomber scombrus]|uniref:Uncharacterized protein n=1 Tax=Scomber scombrus TaxID=13677 RepID=A0AAV1P530_SCOSC
MSSGLFLGTGNKGAVCAVSVRPMGAIRGHAVTGRAGLDPWVLLVRKDKVTFSLLYSTRELVTVSVCNAAPQGDKPSRHPDKPGLRPPPPPPPLSLADDMTGGHTVQTGEKARDYMGCVC